MPGPADDHRPSAWRRLLGLVHVDPTPLRRSPDFRILFGAGTVFYLGGMVTNVALAFQLYHLTGSNFAVGALGLVELVPVVVFGLYGGVLADHLDRRTMLVSCGLGQVLVTAGLLANTLVPHPQLWAIYLCGGLLAVTESLQRPSRDAIIPQVVEHDELPAATTLNSLGSQLGMLAGPAVGGLLVSGPGLPWAYGLDVAGLLVASLLYARLRRHPPRERLESPGLQSVVEGIRYAVGRRDLLGTYLIDVVAMVTAMSSALYPALTAKVLDEPQVLGFLYSAETVGALLAGLTAGWASRIHHHGRAIAVSACAWGAAMIVAGLTQQVWLVLLALGCAGAADQLSGLFRGVLWHQTIPEEKRGRLAGIELLSYNIGPLGGQTRAGLVADATSVRTAIVSGGVLCVAGVAVTAAFLRTLWRYDARTDEHSTRQRALRSGPDR